MIKNAQKSAFFLIKIKNWGMKCPKRVQEFSKKTLLKLKKIILLQPEKWQSGRMRRS